MLDDPSKHMYLRGTAQCFVLLHSLIETSQEATRSPIVGLCRSVLQAPRPEALEQRRKIMSENAVEAFNLPPMPATQKEGQPA